jgi:hypothetical protein
MRRWITIWAGCLLAAAPIFAQTVSAPAGPGVSAPAVPYSIASGTTLNEDVYRLFLDFSPLSGADPLPAFNGLVEAWRGETAPSRKAALRDVLQVVTADSRVALERLEAAGLQRSPTLWARLLGQGKDLRRISHSHRALAEAMDAARTETSERVAEAEAPEVGQVRLPESALRGLDLLGEKPADGFRMDAWRKAHEEARVTDPGMGLWLDKVRLLTDRVWKEPRAFDRDRKVVPYLIDAMERLSAALEGMPHQSRVRIERDNIRHAFRSLVHAGSPLLTPEVVFDLRGMNQAPEKYGEFIGKELDQRFPVVTKIDAAPSAEAPLATEAAPKIAIVEPKPEQAEAEEPKGPGVIVRVSRAGVFLSGIAATFGASMGILNQWERFGAYVIIPAMIVCSLSGIGLGMAREKRGPVWKALASWAAATVWLAGALGLHAGMAAQLGMLGMFFASAVSLVSYAGEIDRDLGTSPEAPEPPLVAAEPAPVVQESNESETGLRPRDHWAAVFSLGTGVAGGITASSLTFFLGPIVSAVVGFGAAAIVFFGTLLGLWAYFARSDRMAAEARIPKWHKEHDSETIHRIYAEVEEAAHGPRLRIAEEPEAELVEEEEEQPIRRIKRMRAD